jgi:hypothetical protein
MPITKLAAELNSAITEYSLGKVAGVVFDLWRYKDDGEPDFKWDKSGNGKLNHYLMRDYNPTIMETLGSPTKETPEVGITEEKLPLLRAEYQKALEAARKDKNFGITSGEERFASDFIDKITRAEKSPGKHKYQVVWE